MTLSRDQVITSVFQQAAEAVDYISRDRSTILSIDLAAGILIDTLRSGGCVYSCGNGGSMCDAMHFAEELSGRFRKDRKGLRGMAISDPAHLTCAANDFGYEAVFSRFIEAHGRAGDVLLAISTSGSSPNIVAAANEARRRGLKVIALTGKSDSLLGTLADCEICAPVAQTSDRIQEIHIKVIHTLIELIERDLFPENYA